MKRHATRVLTIAGIALSIAASGCSSGDDTTGDDGGGDDGTTMEEPPQCTTDEIRSIERPLSSETQASPTFAYQFRYRAPASSDQPTLIFLPGGPGQASIGTPSESFVPAGFGLVQTDPRGVGCNELADVGEPLAFYQTDELAADVVAIVAELGLDNYVLYGVSYGTVLATVTVHRLESSGLPPPRAVILEGVVGRAFATEFVAQGMIDQWDAIYPALPADALAVLAEPAPLGLTAHDWGEYIASRLPLGRGPEGSLLANELYLLSEAAVPLTGMTLEENRAAIAEAVRQAANADPVDAAGLRLFRYVACREITTEATTDGLDVVLEAGRLVPAPGQGSMCTDLSLTTPFDVRRFPSSTKTFYITGERDPNTPAWQGDYHMANHITAERTMLFVPDAGHNAMGYNLGVESMCAVPLVEDMALGGARLAELAAACPRPVELRYAPAGS